jgi:hypothetical protein
LTAATLAACASLICADTSRLALMPLPREALGPDAAALTLARDSGIDSNASAAKNAGGGTSAADLARQGRISGYILDYTAPPTVSPQRLLAVETLAELYRTRANAVGGLAFWRGVTQRLGGTKRNGVAISLVPFAARVGDGAFAFELTYKLGGRTVGYVGDVVFRTGSLLGAVFVTSRDRAGLRARTVALAAKLLTRIHAVEGGKIR